LIRPFAADAKALSACRRGATAICLFSAAVERLVVNHPGNN